jgi:hypothetical protein
MKLKFWPNGIGTASGWTKRPIAVLFLTPEHEAASSNYCITKNQFFYTYFLNYVFHEEKLNGRNIWDL